MDDEPFYSPKAKPPPPQQPKPGELLFQFERTDHTVVRCELRQHEYYCEAQFFVGEDLLLTRTFEPIDDGERIINAREIAIAWAKRERQAIENNPQVTDG